LKYVFKILLSFCNPATSAYKGSLDFCLKEESGDTSLLRLKETPILEGGEELRHLFTYTGVSPLLNMCSGIYVRGLKAHLSKKWKRLMTARKVKEYTDIARL
jgi:hypothetical protein